MKFLIVIALTVVVLITLRRLSVFADAWSHYKARRNAGE